MLAINNLQDEEDASNQVQQDTEEDDYGGKLPQE
jgi:hypothetical protein